MAPLLRFRTATLRGRSRTVALVAFLGMGVITVLAAWLPAYLPGAAASARAADALFLLPSGYLAVLVVAVVSAASSGGGRELMPHEQAVAFPIGPTTDHLGALLMAPLNIAWLLQSWTVLGATAYVLGPTGLWAAQVPVLLWLVVATSLAQLLSWMVEWVRRGPCGIWVARILALVLAAGIGALIATDRLIPVLDASPTVQVLLGALNGSQGVWVPWFAVNAALVASAAFSVAAGALVSLAVSRRPARDELRAESSEVTPRANPASDFAALLRADRVGVWRSVPLRRGLGVLAVLPGLVALAGSLGWDMLTILPGLVASGAALLFGVNSWCLDGRGALWRDSLPVSPKTAFASRVAVLVEVLLLVIAVTLVFASVRAGAPTVTQLVASLCATVVVTVQVVAASMRWSVRRPYASDMRGARATPAPPLVMVGYSTRLALGTTVTGMFFGLLGRLPDWQWPVLVAIPFLLFSSHKLVVTSNEWANPEIRCRVVATVAS